MSLAKETLNATPPDMETWVATLVYKTDKMRIRLLLVSFVFPAFLISCKKNDSASMSGNDCVTSTGIHHGNIIPDQYVVSYRQNQSSGLISARSRGDAMAILQKYQLPEANLVQFIQGSNPGMVVKANSEQVRLLKSDPTVEAVEPDRIVALSTCFTVVNPRLITWNTQRVGYGDGRGKTAWIIDSGVDLDHPDLNVDVNRSRSFFSGQTSAEDNNGHGTHVAGIIAAKNNNIGMLGIASEASIVALKVLDNEGEGTLSGIQAALGYIEQNAVAGDVVNISLGLEGISDYLDTRVIRMANKGILFSIAAGNDSKSASNFSPARANGANIFTVSAVDSLNRFASFSNFGNDVVDYAAPGVQIPSCYLNGRYAIMSGTSMAAPHVAGLLLLNGNKISSSTTARNDPDGTPDPVAHK